MLSQLSMMIESLSLFSSSLYLFSLMVRKSLRVGASVMRDTTAHIDLYIDILDDMSFEEGEIFTERLILVSQKEKYVDYNIPIEYLVSELWRFIRQIDAETATQVMQETFLLWKEQVNDSRSKWDDLDTYLDYRVRDGAGM